MKAQPTSFEASPALLGAFVRAVAGAGDSPTVIRRVAENNAYVDFCRRIAALESDEAAPPQLAAACRRADITLARLRSRLAPVARALHLLPEDNAAEYYQVLGVAPDSTPEIIKSAYRRRVRGLHPDLRPQQDADHQAFTRLTRAYETLRDPAAREAYDTRRRADESWFEPDPLPVPVPVRPRRGRLTAVIVAVLLLVGAALLLDQMDRETSRRNVFRAANSRITPPLPPPAGLAQSASPHPEPAPPPEPGTEGPLITPAAATQPLEPVPAPAPAVAAPAPPLPEAPAPTMVAQAPQPVEMPVPTQGKAPLPAGATPPEAAPWASSAAPQAAAPEPRLGVFYPAGADDRLPEALTAHLAERRYPAPRLAASSEAGRRASNVRYFNAADREAARALRKTVQAFLARAGGRQDPRVDLINLSRRYPEANPGLLEVWLNTEPAPTEENKTIFALPAAPPPEPQTAAVPAAEALSAQSATENRIRTFLADYCRTYETRDPDRLAEFFLPTATENGQPFKDLLPLYRANMALMAQLSYAIDMDRWSPREGTANLLVEGRFTARGELADRKQYQSRGTIALDLVPQGGSYRVSHLHYTLD